MRDIYLRRRAKSRGMTSATLIMNISDVPKWIVFSIELEYI